MRIYVVMTELDGCPEDRTKEIVYVGFNKALALQYERPIDYRLYLEVWENGKAVGEYTQDCSGGWRWNFGEKLGNDKGLD